MLLVNLIKGYQIRRHFSGLKFQTFYLIDFKVQLEGCRNARLFGRFSLKVLNPFKVMNSVLLNCLKIIQIHGLFLSQFIFYPEWRGAICH